MDRYFLHIRNGQGPQADPTGQLFPSPALAIAEAARTAGELVREDSLERAGQHDFEIDVADENARIIAHIRLQLIIPAVLA